MKMSTVINISAILLTILAIVIHSEAITILILAAGTFWCAGFMVWALTNKEQEERDGKKAR